MTKVSTRMLPLGQKRRLPLRLDAATWQAVEILASRSGITWQDWCARVLQSAGNDSTNMTAVVRSAAMDGLLGESIVAERAEQFTGPQAVAMQMAGICNNSVFAEDIRAGAVQSSSEFGGFTLRSGTDENGRVCFWIENGLKEHPNAIVRTPFTPEQWRNALRAIGEEV